MSQRLVKLATSLQRKKNRDIENAFVAEGEKLVLDLLATFNAKHILCSENWSEKHPKIKTVSISEQLLKKASGLKTPAEVIGIFEKPKKTEFNSTELPALVLDTIQDPGNLGSIIRTAAWFGIKHIICSPQTADIYNPKVVQATMGALGNLQVHYLELEDFLSKMQKQNVHIFGTFLEGESLYKTTITKNSLIVIGNEGSGIADNLKQFITSPIHIPSFGQNPPESLNASVSAAIVCSEMMRTIRS